MRRIAPGTILLLSLALISHASSPGQHTDRQAPEVPREAKEAGGLVVQIGCGNGSLLGALGRNEGLLVHGLDVDPARIEAARRHLRPLGMYGRVSVERWSPPRLPYADDLVNVVVTEDPSAVSMEEIMRVLAPGGTACIRRGGAWTRTVKPWPGDIDEWTHYLHGADNNPVSRDGRIGPPNQMRWVAAPRRSRSHEYAPSLAAMVSAVGRLFCIQDEGLRGILDSRIGDRWALQARDAFNGLPLWKRFIPGWGGGEWRDRSHWGVPMSLPRRLVADGARVYATLGYRAPVTELDARTGEVIRVHETTAQAEELILTEGVLLVRRRKRVPDYHPNATPWSVQFPRKPGKTGGGNNRMREPLGGKTQKRDAPPASQPVRGDDAIVAIRTRDGKVLWTWPETRIVTLSLAARNGRVCYHNFEELVCLDLGTGKELWREKSRSWPDLVGTGGTVVMAGDLVFLADDRGVQARKADSGKQLWKGKRILRSAPRQPSEIFIAGGLLWGSLTPEMPTGTVPKEQSPFAVEPMSGTEVQGLDPETGQVRKSIDIGTLISHGHHIRCYRGKATERFLMWVK
ncbi:MAG: PQQ-binding-like beta-propeller repeat protein, partial [Phycisphaerae bacterium]